VGEEDIIEKFEETVKEVWKDRGQTEGYLERWLQYLSIQFMQEVRLDPEALERGGFSERRSLTRESKPLTL